MPIREMQAGGREALLLTSELLRRARLADGLRGIWEPADPQWWWRRPRPSDDVAQPFWVDDDGPVAGVRLTGWPRDRWQCDVLTVPEAGRSDGPTVAEVWAAARDLVRDVAPPAVDVPVHGDDAELRALAEADGLAPGEGSSEAWLRATDRPDVVELPAPYRLVDRVKRADRPHWLSRRSGEAVAERLAQCPLYDPALDLAVVTDDGTVAAYSVYWHDPATGVGLVEPVRVEDEFQRRGLARAMLSHGLDRLARRGAHRLKIGFETEAAGSLYRSVGFVEGAYSTWYDASAWLS